MYNVLVFDKQTGEGLDIDYLDDGRIIVDKLSSEDMGFGDEGKSWQLKKK
jgi:hypothetical protein